MGSLDGRVAVVTGGAQGIGKASCIAFAREGARGLIIADLNLAKAEDVCKEISDTYGCLCVPFKIDITNAEDVRQLFITAVETFGTVDVFVNSAGICPLGSIEDIGEKEWDFVSAVDLKGAYLCSREAFLLMKERRFGKIINISSMAGRQGGITSGVHYSTTKGGIITMTKQFAKAAAPFNINCNAIAPGLIETDMTATFGYKKESVPLGRIGTAEDCANAIEFLASERSSYITGCTIDINGGIYMN